MGRQRLFLMVFVLGILVLFAIPAANADPIKKATEVTFSQPTEIPGMVLLAGTYVIKIPDPVTHADMVGFYNTDQSHLYKLVRTIPKYRIEVTDKTSITFEERARGAPDAMKSWFYPGDNWGKEFVYEKANPVTIAEAAPLAPAPAPEEVIAPEVAATPVPAIENAPEPVAEAPEAPVEVAEAAPVPAAQAEELPKTATGLPLAALLGGFTLTLGGLLRWRVAKRLS